MSVCLKPPCPASRWSTNGYPTVFTQSVKRAIAMNGNAYFVLVDVRVPLGDTAGVRVPLRDTAGVWVPLDEAADDLVVVGVSVDERVSEGVPVFEVVNAGDDVTDLVALGVDVRVLDPVRPAGEKGGRRG